MESRTLIRGAACKPTSRARAVALLALLGIAAPCFANAASPAVTPAASPGQAVYAHWCAPCHAPGAGHPGTQSLQLKYGGRLPAVLLERTDLSPKVIAKFVREGVLSMAPFRKTEITDAQLDALAAYVSSKYSAR